MRQAVWPVYEQLADLPAGDFSTAALEVVREQMITSGLSRKVINGRINRIRRMFRWAEAKGLIPLDRSAHLATLDVLKKGRTEAPDHPEIERVTPDIVEKTLPFLPPVVADMVRLPAARGLRVHETGWRTCVADWLPHEFANHGVPAWQQFYTPELRDIVGKIYRKEIDRFGFNFSPSGDLAKDRIGDGRTTPFSDAA